MTNTNDRTGSLRSRFTLVELLVVIAIIAILASMLLPMLGKAKERGRHILCVNNLKQLSLNSMLYADEWEEYVPPSFTMASDLWWRTLLRAGYAPEALWYDGIPRGSLNQENIFHCPTATQRYGEGDYGYGYLTAYGSPFYVMGRGPCENNRPFKRLPSFTTPADTVLLFDATIKRTWSYCGRNYAAYWGSGSAAGLHALFRRDHAAQSTFAFIDLHVDTSTGWDYVNATAFPSN